jgi:hypothetical protein
VLPDNEKLPDVFTTAEDNLAFGNVPVDRLSALV